MKGKNVVILFVAAVVLVAAAVLTSKDKAAQAPSLAGRKVLPDLPVNDVEKIIVNSGGKTVTVARAEGRWVLPRKFGYPADFKKVREALLKLEGLKIGQSVRAADAQRSRMKIADPRPDGSGGTLVSLVGKSGAAVASVLLGATREKEPEADAGPTRFGGYPDGRYLSPDGGKSIYLVAETLNDLTGEEKEWMETEIVSVNSGDISAISISGEGRTDVKLAKPEGGKLEMADIPAGKELDTSKTYGVESALSYLRFNDIADPALKDDALGMDKPVVYRAETKKGEIYTARVGKSPAGSGDRYLRIEVALKPEAPAAPAAATAEGEKKDAEAQKKQDEEQKKKEQERKDLETKVAEQNRKFAGWTYLISSYTAESMTKTADALLKDKEVKPAATNATASVSAPAATDAANAPAAE